MNHYVTELDYFDDMEEFQKQLDEAKIDYNITNLAGCTYSELANIVSYMIAFKKCSDMKKFQNKLDEAEIDYDVTNLIGCDYSEIESIVNYLIKCKKINIENKGVKKV